MPPLRGRLASVLACRRTATCVVVVAAVLAAPLLAGCAATPVGAEERADRPPGARGGEADGARPVPSSTPEEFPLPAMLPAAAPVLVLGDSLALGLYPYLASRLPDRRIEYDAVVGTSTAWARNALERRLNRSTAPPVLVVSAGTNDSSANVATWRHEVERVLTLAGPDRCVVWTTIARPKSRGGDPKAFNRVLAELDEERDNLTVVDWAALVEDNTGWLTDDGVHGTNAGMVGRARAIAEAVFACSPLDPTRTVTRQPVPSAWGSGGSGRSAAPPRSTGSPSTAVTAKPTGSAAASPAASATGSATAQPSDTASPDPTPTQTQPTSEPPTDPPTAPGPPPG